jgi:cell division protease FtsH
MHGIKSTLSSFTARAGQRIKGGKPLRATKAWRLLISAHENPFITVPGRSPIRRPKILAVRRVPFDGYVYDLCGMGNEAFFGGNSPLLLHNTNRPDVLDSALLRPGRFDRHVTVDRPTWQGRLEILKVHTRNKPLADDVNLEEIARKMIGMTGADLRNLANEAALIACREDKARIDRSDFENAADRVLMGPKRDEVLSEDDKRRTAYHESGHAIVGWFVPAGDPPQKVTIVPRGRAGGVTMFSPDEDRMHHGLDYFKSQLAIAMGGRAAERLMFGQPYAGAEADLKQATRLARYMVTHWGMSDKLGPMSFRIGEEHIFLGKEIQEPRDFSEETAHLIDEEVRKFLLEADERAAHILTEHRPQMDRLVDLLMQKEEIFREDLEAVLGKRAADRTNETAIAGVKSHIPDDLDNKPTPPL